MISIITVSSNSEEHITDTILSILGQTYQHYEYIIIDNASSDNTVEIIKSFESAFNGRLKWVSEPDNGIYDAMNKGIDLASGELIGILNSDDYYSKITLELVARTYNNNLSSGDHVIVTGSLCKVDANKNPLFILKTNIDGIDKALDSSFTINHPATFVAIKVYNEVGWFNTVFKYAGDYDFFYRAFKHGGINIYSIDEVLVYMRSGGVTDKLQNIFRRAFEEFMVRKKSQHLLKNIIFAGHYFMVGFFKMLLKRIVSDKIIKKYYRYKDKLPLIVKKIAKI